MKKASMRVFALLMVVGLMLIPAFSAAAQQGGTTLYLPIVYKPIPAPPVERVGPAGGTFTSVVVDPTNPAVLYVGTFGQGVFKSQDGGQSWQAMNNGLGNLTIQSLAIRSNATTLYAGTYGSGIYRSLDSGETWEAINGSGGNVANGFIVYDVEPDPSNAQRLFITGRVQDTWNGSCCLVGYIYRTTNDGASWTTVWDGLQSYPLRGDYAYDIDIDPNSSSTIYFTGHEHGVFKNTSNGDSGSWTPVQGSLTGVNLSTRRMALDPNNSLILYNSVYFDSNGLYKSTNGGSTWSIKNAGLARPIYGYALTIDPANPATLYLGTAFDGIYKSTNRAEDTWSNIGLYSQFIWDLDANGSQVYAGTGGNGLQASSDGGGNWATRNSGIFGTNVTGLVSFNGMLYAGVNGGGVYASGNQGTSWQPANNGLADLNVQSLLVLTRNSVSNLYALTGTQLFMLSADGSTWSVAVSRNNAPALAPEGPATEEPAVESVEPFIQNSILPEEEQQLLRIDRTAPSDLDSTSSYGTLKQITAAATNWKGLWIGAYNGGVLLSTGECSAYSDRTVYALHVSKADGGLYGSLPDKSGGFTVIKWVSCPIPPEVEPNWDTKGAGFLPGTQVYNFASNSTRTFAASKTGVYYMPPNGSSWTQASGYGGVVNAITVDPANENRLYAATDKGAYYSVDNGANWAQAPQDALQNVVFLSVSVDPGNPNLVYFGSKDGSTYRWDKSK